MKTLADLKTAEFLRSRFILAFHNQLPGLYCNNTVDPGADRYPDDQVDRCAEGAGGGNVRLYVCAPNGRILSLTLGYWRPERLQSELCFAFRIWEARGNLKEVRRLHRAHIEEHERRRAAAQLPKDAARENLLIRGHEEACRDLRTPISYVLDRIEEEIYTQGKIG